MTNQAIPLPVHRNAVSLIDPATLHFLIFLQEETLFRTSSSPGDRSTGRHPSSPLRTCGPDGGLRELELKTVTTLTAQRPTVLPPRLPPHLPLLGLFQNLIPWLSYLAGSPSPRREQHSAEEIPPVQASGVQIIPTSETLQPSTVDDEAASSRLPGIDALKEMERNRPKVRQPTYSLFPEPTARSRFETSDSQPLDKAVDDTERPVPKLLTPARSLGRVRVSAGGGGPPLTSSLTLAPAWTCITLSTAQKATTIAPKTKPVQGHRRCRFVASCNQNAPDRSEYVLEPAGYAVETSVNLSSGDRILRRSRHGSACGCVLAFPAQRGLTFTLDYDLFSSDDSDAAAPFETGARVPGPPASSSTQHPVPSRVLSNVLCTSEPTPLGASSEGGPLHLPQAANAFATSRRTSPMVASGLGESAIGPDQDLFSQERLRALFGDDEIGQDSLWAFNRHPSGSRGRNHTATPRA
ncbi:hypothetical protein V8E54_007390 [Elaphomyces granulatus]